MIDREELLRVAQSRIGNPYLLGGKWALKDGNPQGPIDCSGYVRWCYAQIGILLPDGCDAQFASCRLVTKVLPGDLGFFRNDGSQVDMHHVGMVFDDNKVIEARGAPYNQVIFRPRAKWEAWKDFTGWMRPYAVLNIEGGQNGNG